MIKECRPMLLRTFQENIFTTRFLDRFDVPWLTEDDATRAMAPIDKGMISFLASPQIRLPLLELASPFLPFLGALSFFATFSDIMEYFFYKSSKFYSELRSLGEMGKTNDTALGKPRT